MRVGDGGWGVGGGGGKEPVPSVMSFQRNDTGSNTKAIYVTMSLHPA